MRFRVGFDCMLAVVLTLLVGCGDSESGGIGGMGGSGGAAGGIGGTGGIGGDSGAGGLPECENPGDCEEVDVDNDGYVAMAAGGDDCDDNNPAVNPGGIEVCNGIDDDCDTRADERNAVGCSSYYLDADDDIYGSTDSRCLCGPNTSAGYDVTNNADCYDRNPDARPGQTEYFYDDRGDGSWDYNCDGIDTKIDNRTELFSCTPELFTCTFSEGWETAAPACGETRNYGTGCFFVPLVSCEPNILTPIHQRCR